ncbi:MAG TPA: ankyrin repeat domain-containing protein [Rhizomicrobium sp.]
MNGEFTDLKSVLAAIQNITGYLGIDLETVDQRSIFGDTPLGVAVVWNDIEAAKILLDNGADVNARQEDNATPLHEAARFADARMAELLIERGADPTLRDDMFDETPLERARSHNNRGVVEVLEKHGTKNSG